MNENNDEVLLKVGSSTTPGSLAATINLRYEENPNVKINLRGMGAGALNQATKAVIVASKRLASKGIYISLVPCFVEIEVKTSKGLEKRTTIAQRLTFNKIG